MPEDRYESSHAFRASPEYRDACKKLGRRIREAREGKGLTLDEVSARVGMNLSHWSEVEAGTVNVRFDTLLRISKALEVRARDLLRDL